MSRSWLRRGKSPVEASPPKRCSSTDDSRGAGSWFHIRLFPPESPGHGCQIRIRAGLSLLPTLSAQGPRWVSALSGMRICTTRRAPPPTHEAPPGLAALTTIQARADDRARGKHAFPDTAPPVGNLRGCGARPDRAWPADDAACRNVAGLVATCRQ